MLKFLPNLVKHRKKGAVWGYLIVFVIIVLLEIVVFSTQFQKDILRERSFIESYYLIKGSQLDTYVKAYLLSLQTSLLQAIYDVGCKKDQLWQRYGDNFMPTKEELEKEIKERTELYSNISLQVLRGNKKGIEIPEKNKIKEVKIENFVSASVFPVTFNLSKKEINITYTFSPKVEINTSFKEIYDKARELINERKIKNLIIDAIREVKNEYKLPDSLPSQDSCEDTFKDNTGYTYSEVGEFIGKKINETVNSFSFEDYFLRVYFYILDSKGRVEDSKNGNCNYYYYGSVEVLVNITENPSNYFNYTLYDSCERNQVIQDNLRLNFRIIDGSYGMAPFSFANCVIDKSESKVVCDTTCKSSPLMVLSNSELIYGKPNLANNKVELIDTRISNLQCPVNVVLICEKPEGIGVQTNVQC